MGGPIKQDSFFRALAGLDCGEKGNIWFDLEKFEGESMQYSATTMTAMIEALS